MSNPSHIGHISSLCKVESPVKCAYSGKVAKKTCVRFLWLSQCSSENFTLTPYLGKWGNISPVGLGFKLSPSLSRYTLVSPTHAVDLLDFEIPVLG